MNGFFEKINRINRPSGKLTQRKGENKNERKD